MELSADRIDDLNHEDLTRFIMDLFHRIAVHYGFWFAEVRHQMGMNKALEIMETASRKSFEIQSRRLAKHFGFEMQGNIPTPLLAMSNEELLRLADDVAVNWLANDGVWFQAVEFAEGMNDAKRCNDSCWAQFSPFEAWSIKKFLNLPEKPGLPGLKKALKFRFYARITRQSYVDEDENRFVYQMNDCRVQAARKRKALNDYPCKSGGLVEYTYFARTIDERIVTECVGCPPDDHPAEWYCAWRFKIKASV